MIEEFVCFEKRGRGVYGCMASSRRRKEDGCGRGASGGKDTFLMLRARVFYARLRCRA